LTLAINPIAESQKKQWLEKSSFQLFENELTLSAFASAKNVGLVTDPSKKALPWSTETLGWRMCGTEPRRKYSKFLPMLELSKALSVVLPNQYFPENMNCKDKLVALGRISLNGMDREIRICTIVI